jgi:hypothetical protein
MLEKDAIIFIMDFMVRNWPILNLLLSLIWYIGRYDLCGFSIYEMHY